MIYDILLHSLTAKFHNMLYNIAFSHIGGAVGITRNCIRDGCVDRIRVNPRLDRVDTGI